MGCKNLHIVTNYTVPQTGTILALSFSNAVTSVSDKQRFCIKVCTSIPSIYDTYNATVDINGTAVPLWDKYGDLLTISELKKCKVMKGYVGLVGLVNHIILTDIPVTCNCGCPSAL